MVEPPKLSPFSGTNDAYGCASLGKTSGENATVGEAANPVPSFFSPRMLAVCQLKSLWIEKRFDGLWETHFVLPDIVIVF
mgnify:CR=1 FL=1